MGKSIVIGKFLPYHSGHKQLLEFADYMSSMFHHDLSIIICRKDDDYIPYVDRFSDILKEFRCHVGCIDYTQYPEQDEPGFMDAWVKGITDYVGDVDVVFAGEDYGLDLANALGAKFIPFPRNSLPISGTMCRQDIEKYWLDIGVKCRQYLHKQAVIIGPESTGKTTLLSYIRNYMGDTVLCFDEWARHYLNSVGTEVTQEKMSYIVAANMGIEFICFIECKRPYSVLDTDNLTTLGYSRLYNMQTRMPKFGPSENIKYFIMDDQTVPFVPDAQRYGGNKRETDTKYWIDLCKEFRLNYEVMNDRNKMTIINWLRS